MVNRRAMLKSVGTAALGLVAGSEGAVRRMRTRLGLPQPAQCQAVPS